MNITLWNVELFGSFEERIEMGDVRVNATVRDLSKLVREGPALSGTCVQAQEGEAFH
jgi:hypothetical protein